MPTAIQIFTNYNRLLKRNYKEWRGNYEWPNQIESKNGFLENSTLYLPNKVITHDAEKANFVIINDIIGFDKEAQLRQFNGIDLPEWYKNRILEQIDRVKEHYFFQGLSSICRVEILNFKRLANNNIEVYLNYQNHEGSIGKPARQNHKIAELKLWDAIRFSVNGKYDFNASSGAERSYNEYDYIINFLGEFSEIKFLNPQEIGVIKPLELPVKWIDERKILY
jgi:hypothetical protein